jgi:hypothetical protein
MMRRRQQQKQQQQDGKEARNGGGGKDDSNTEGGREGQGVHHTPNPHPDPRCDSNKANSGKLAVICVTRMLADIQEAAR